MIDVPSTSADALEVWVARHRRVILTTGLLLALALRVGFVEVGFRSSVYNPYRQCCNARTYVSQAVSLARGEGFSIHYRGDIPFGPASLDSLPAASQPPLLMYRYFPGFPVFLAGVFRVFGFNLHIVTLLQALLSAASVWLVYRLGREVGGTVASIVAFALAAVYVPFAVDAVSLLPEIVVTFSLTLALLAAVRFVKQPGIARGLWYGLVAGGAVFVKAVALPLVPLGIAAVFLNRKARRTAIVATCALMMAFAGLLAPVALRNYRLFGHFTVLPAYGGAQMLLLHNPHPRPNLWDPPGWLDGADPRVQLAYDEAVAAAHFPEGARPNAFDLDEAYRRYAVASIVQDPVQAMRNAGRSFANVFGRVDFETARFPRRLSNWVCYAAMIPFFFLGCWTAFRRRDPALLLLVAFAGAFVVVHMVAAAEMRYRTGIMPVFFVLAGAGVMEARRLFSGLRED